jgi:ElaB/YqjD/DUF883 family membrane-anchored ribosome-binding protein
MQKDKAFPTSRQDLANLKQTAFDAAADLSSTASVHAGKARSQLNELAGHVREEGRDQLSLVKGSLEDVICSARDYVSARPLAALGIALGIGFLIGLSRRRGSSND